MASTKGRHRVQYEFTTAAPITEEEALEQVAAMGLHGLAFDDAHGEAWTAPINKDPAERPEALSA